MAVDAASRLIKDERKDVPRRNRRDASLKARTPIQEFQDADMWVRSFVVRLDLLVVRESAKHFAVTGVRKLVCVLQLGRRVSRRIAEDLPLFCDRLPEK